MRENQSELRRQDELAIARAVADHLNRRDGSGFEFERHDEPNSPPDTWWRDRDGRMLPVEAARAYYDDLDADNTWDLIVDPEVHMREWSNWKDCTDEERKKLMEREGIDSLMLDSVQRIITKKCGKSYPSGTVLGIGLQPMLHTISEIEPIMDRLVVPDTCPFAEIHIVADTPGAARNDRVEPGGRFIITLDESNGMKPAARS